MSLFCTRSSCSARSCHTFNTRTSKSLNIRTSLNHLHLLEFFETAENCPFVLACRMVPCTRSLTNQRAVPLYSR